MSWFSDAIEWGAKTIFGDGAGTAVGEFIDSAEDFEIFGVQPFDWFEEGAEELAKETAKSFLGVGPDGKPAAGFDPSKVQFQRSSVRTQTPGMPSLSQMGYTPRVMDSAARAARSTNRHVQDQLNLVRPTIQLTAPTITLNRATLPSKRIGSKYNA